MKKILAALLVVVMVVSLFPATVFAANGDECLPANGHSKAQCDKLGIKYEKFGETVKPACGQNGYTTYKCECGAYFYDDIIVMPNHERDENAKPVSARVEATCKDYGMAAFYTCTLCGENYPEYIKGDKQPAADENAPAGAIAKLPHNTDPVVYPEDKGCVSESVICNVCGELVKLETPNEKHDFDYQNPHAITKAPSTESCAPGEAIFACKTPGCKKTITLRVESEAHELALLTLVDEVPATCTATGIKEHYMCDSCKSLFIDLNGKAVLVEAADLVIPVEHDFAAKAVELPTCTKYGYEFYICNLCGHKEIKNEVAPLGCTTLAEALAHDADPEKVKEDGGKWVTITPAKSCTDQTKYEWTCHEECYCNGVKEVCGQKFEKLDAAKGHTTKTYSIPATVEYPYAYTYTVCTAKNCDAAVVEGLQTVTYGGKNYTLNVSVKADGGSVYEMNDEEKAAVRFLKVTKVTEKDVTECGNAHYYEITRIKAATCTADGSDSYTCKTCLKTVSVKVAKLGHDYSDYSEYKCGVDKTKIHCVRCDKYLEVAKADAKHKLDLTADPVEIVETPTCRKAAGEYYACEYCGKAIVDETSPNYKKFTFVYSYASLADAQAAHVGVKVLPGGTSYKGSCEVVGKTQYYCSTCGTNKGTFFVEDATTGHHTAPLDTPYNDKEANCLVGKGYTEDYFCTVCGKLVPAAEPLPHKLSEIVAAKDATCTEDGNVAYATCSNECCLVDVGTNGVEDLQPGYIKVIYDVPYVDENGLNKTKTVYEFVGAKENVIIKAEGHDIKSNGAVKENCTTPGYTAYYCANEKCDLAYVADYVEPTGHKKGQLDELKPTCSVDGYKYYKCANAGCTGDDGLSKTAADKKDDGVYTSETVKYEVLPAIGHVNASNQVFFNKCTDTTADRVCIRKDCDSIELDKDGKRLPIKADCAMSKEETVAATCVQGAYKISVCENGCGKTVMTPINDSKPLGHQFAWGATGANIVNDADLLYWEDGEIVHAGDKYIENINTFRAKWGFDAITAYTPATFEANGSITFKCEGCKEVVTLEITKSPEGFSLDVDNALVSGANDVIDANGNAIFADGDIIAVNVNLSAYKTNVCGFSFDLTYNTSALNYLGYTTINDKIFTDTTIKHIYKDVKIPYDNNNDGIEESIYEEKNASGTVKMVAFTDMVNGKMTDVEMNGTQTVVTLYFQVDAFYKFAINGIEKSGYDYYFYFELDGAITDSTGEYTDESIVHEDFAVAELMDVDCSGKVNAIDMADVCRLIESGEYSAYADVNEDGVVNMADAMLICDYITGNIDLIGVILSRAAWKAPADLVA